MTHHFQELRKSKAIFKAILSGLSREEYRWRWQEDKWCLLEILCHLYDEEREDFRLRCKSVLEDPSKPLPPFNPTLWVLERNYMGKNYEDTLAAFMSERDASLSWLESLEDPQWGNTYQHPKMGPITAGFFLSNWVAHDYLHIRQILKLKYLYLAEQTGDDLRYAGTW